MSHCVELICSLKRRKNCSDKLIFDTNSWIWFDDDLCSYYVSDYMKSNVVEHSLDTTAVLIGRQVTVFICVASV